MSSSSSIEVEEKFNVPSDIEERLIQQGFVRKRRIEMTDWYFDTPSLELLKQNVWLRYRQPHNYPDNATDDADTSNVTDQTISQWQIKVKKESINCPTELLTSSTTIYEELEGLVALTTAASYLVRQEASSNRVIPQIYLHDNVSLFANQTIPKLPEIALSDSCLLTKLVPLARIYTCRTSWTNAELEMGVDLDETDFGHAVGEVEMVIENESQINDARKIVRKWAMHLQDTNNTQSQAMGKLEYYLFHYRPHVYNVCLQSGALK